MFLLSLKKTESYFDFPENILDITGLPPHEDFRDVPIFWEIYKNIHLLNSNQIILFNGLPRTGKSEASLDFAWNLDVDPMTGEKLFSLDNYAYTLKGYMGLIKNTKRVGAALTWEEAGMSEFGANARDFLSKENKDASTIFQSMGFKRHLNLINLPLKTMMDKQLRSLVHWIVTTEKINTKSQCVAKIYKTDLKTIKDEVWNTRYVFADSHGMLKRVQSIRVPRAPLEIRREYKIISDKFKDDVQEHISQKDDAWRKLAYFTTDGKIINKKLLEEFKENMINYLDFKKKKLDLNVFMIKNNVPTRFGPQIRPVLNVFNTDISNGLIKFDEKTVNALVKWEQNHKKSKKKEKVLEQELEREVAQKTKRKFDLASDK
jgi:hypothetical protein